MPWAIYVLEHPLSSEVRYLGKTVQDPRRRLQHHMTLARTGRAKTHCANWIRSLLVEGLAPVMRIVETGPDEDGWKAAEVAWIAKLRTEGVRLTNLTNGGEGLPGRKHSEETKAKMRAASKIVQTDPDFRARHAAATRKAQACSETRRRHSESLKQFYSDPENRRKLTERLREADPQRLEAVRVARTDPEKEARRLAGLHAYWERLRSSEGTNTT